MAAKFSGTSPDKRHKYDKAFGVEALRLVVERRSTQAAGQQLGVSPKLRYRWQQDWAVDELGSVEVVRDHKLHACAQITNA